MQPAAHPPEPRPPTGGALTLLAASGILGYGFDADAFARGVAMGPVAIGCDGGSMDPGPYYMGAGTAFVSREACARDLRLMVRHGRRAGVPVLVGSAGGAGGEPHLAWTLDVLAEVARAEGVALKVAVIHAEPDRAVLRDAVRAGRVRPLGPMPDLGEADVDAAERIVAMMGPEPLVAALRAGADVVLAGRCSDAALFAAPALLRGAAPGPAWHLGKIIECGAAVALPKLGSDCMVGHLHGDHFVVETPNPAKTCPRIRVAAHTLYETPDPYSLHEPGGTLDTTACTYEQVHERAVRVAGSRFAPDPYTVKLEGVALAGYRSMTLAGIRDPGLIGQIDAYLAALRRNVARRAADLGFADAEYTLYFRQYGRNAVMGEREPLADHLPHELGVVAEVVAPTQERAHTLLSLARHLLLHSDFEGRLCISGNAAFPYSPSDIDLGPVYRFSVWHTLALDDPLAPFPITWHRL